MKYKVITLTILPVTALTACDDDPDRHRTKANPPQRTYIQQAGTANQVIYTQKADGTYYKCTNGKVVSEGQSCGTSGGGGSSFGGSRDDTNKTIRNGFGSSGTKTGG